MKNKDGHTSYLLVEGNGGAVYFGVYDDLEKARHCTGSIGAVNINRKLLTQCAEEDYPLFEDNSSKRKVHP
jgi:hypothetical protein